MHGTNILHTIGGCTFTVVTDHKAPTYFKEKNHTAGCHIRWQNFFYGFNCKTIYIEGHKNKVADALSHYYSSLSDKDLHYDNFVSADIRIDKLGECYTRLPQVWARPIRAGRHQVSH